MILMGLSASQLGSAFDTFVSLPVTLRVCLPGTPKPTPHLIDDSSNVPVCPWLVESLGTLS